MKTFRWQEYRNFADPMRRASIPVLTLRTALNRRIVRKVGPSLYRWSMITESDTWHDHKG
jgi:hypothetical protein